MYLIIFINGLYRDLLCILNCYHGRVSKLIDCEMETHLMFLILNS